MWGGGILFQKTPSKCEVLNDLDGDLINFWRVVQSDGDKLINSFQFIPPSRQLFDEYKQKYLTHNYKDNFERAHIFYYLNRAGFASDMKNPSFGSHKNDRSRYRPSTVRNKIERVFERLQDVTLECKDFSEVIPMYDSKDSFFYMDPPYRCSHQYIVGKFEDERYKELAELCKKLKGKCLITLNDDEYVRDTFIDLNVVDHEVFYSAGKDEESRRKFGEVVITNYELQKVGD